MLQKNFLLLLSFLVLLTSISTNLVLASSSEDDDGNNDSQNEQGSKNDETSQQSQVTWKTFKDRDNLFTVQYPSNWTPSTAAESERSGPIDTIFSSPGATATTGSDVEFIQFAQKSVFSTPREALESEISSLQNDPTVTKFQIEQPLECSKYTLNGLPACSYIYEVHTTDGPNLAIMAVDALAQDGTEYEVYYHSDFDSFEHFLPAVESMVKSFQATGTGTGTDDFSLSGGDTNTTGLLGANSSSNEDDFSLG